MVGTIAPKDIVQYHIALFPGPVNIKIRRAFAVQVQKALKIQVQFQGADIGNTQAVRYNTIGSTATSDMQESHRIAVTDNVPSNQEVTAELQLVNYREFLFYPFPRRSIIRA